MGSAYASRSQVRNRGIQRIQQLTFGELVSSLELCDPDASVVFTFGLTPAIRPGEPFLHNYMGIHDQAAIGYTDEHELPTVQHVIDALKPLESRSIFNERGDLLLINQDTPMWAARSDNDTTAIVGVTEDTEWNTVFLQTWAMPTSDD